MGAPKALLNYEGAPLIARIATMLGAVFSEIIVVSSDERFAAAAGAPRVGDVFPDKGVMGGVHAALAHFEKPVFCVACDMPFLRTDVLQFMARLEGSDAFVPRIDGFAEPLHAVYTPALRPVFEAALGAERPGSMEKTLRGSNVRWLDGELRAFDDGLKFLTNWNLPEDVPFIVPMSEPS